MGDQGTAQLGRILTVIIQDICGRLDQSEALRWLQVRY